jgi:hypothetical protein
MVIAKLGELRAKLGRRTGERKISGAKEKGIAGETRCFLRSSPKLKYRRATPECPPWVSC